MNENPNHRNKGVVERPQWIWTLKGFLGDVFFSLFFSVSWKNWDLILELECPSFLFLGKKQHTFFWGHGNYLKP